MILLISISMDVVLVPDISISELGKKILSLLSRAENKQMTIEQLAYELRKECDNPERIALEMDHLMRYHLILLRRYHDLN